MRAPPLRAAGAPPRSGRRSALRSPHGGRRDRPAFLDLSNAQIGLFSVACMVLLLVAGLPIGVTMIVVGFAGIWLIRGDPGLGVRTLSQARPNT